MAFPSVTTVLDNFNRADESPAGGWTDIVGVSQVFINRWAPIDITPTRSTLNAATYGPDSEVYATIQTKDSVADSRHGVIARYNPATDAGYIGWAETKAGTDEWFIFRRDSGGAFTQLGSTGTAEFAAADKIGLEIIGSTLNLYHFTGGSWSLRVTASDSTYSAAGRLGLYSFAASARFDDFSGGTAVATAGFQGRILISSEV
jgi:hypothetical protein